jgi:hypothetical protein
VGAARPPPIFSKIRRRRRRIFEKKAGGGTLQLLVDESLERGVPLYTGLFDLSKAFDRVDSKALLAVMLFYGFEVEHVAQVDDLHTGTWARIKWGGVRSDAFLINWGVQQGSPASNPAWNLFAQNIIDDMLKELGPEVGVEIIWHVDGQLHRGTSPSAAAVPTRQIVLLLADDITVTSSTEEGLRLATAALNRAARRWGMELSAEKSKVLVFRRQTRPAPSRAAAEGSASAFLDAHASGSRLTRAAAASMYICVYVCFLYNSRNILWRCGAAETVQGATASLFLPPRSQSARAPTRRRRRAAF